MRLAKIPIIVFLIFHFLIPHVSAEESKELSTLRTAWQKSRSAAIEPIDKKYLELLTAVRLKYTKAGDLDGALLVDKEIKALASKSDVTKDTREAGSVDKTREVLIGKWLFKNGSWEELREFKLDGLISRVRDGANIGKWDITKKRIVVNYGGATNNPDLIELPLNPSGTKAKDGSNRTMNLTKQ